MFRLWQISQFTAQNPNLFLNLFAAFACGMGSLLLLFGFLDDV